MALSLNNSNKDVDFVGRVIKTPWLNYFRSVKETHMTHAGSVGENCCSISAQKTTKKMFVKTNTDSDLKASARAALCK